MNKLIRSNIYSLIEVYILNERQIPTYQGLYNYDKMISNILDENKLNKESTGKLILDFFVFKIEEYYKKTGKFPYRANLLAYNDTYKAIFGVFIGKFESKYDTLMLHYFRRNINSSSSTKMKSAVKEEYLKHETLFEDFFLLNLEKENRKREVFNKTGSEIKEIIQEIENYVVGRMEGGQYGVFSGSTRDKFINYIKSLFPLYDQIGVKIRHL